jgi:hypothetical protein
MAPIAVATALIATAVGPALAVDATGTWSGTWTCRQTAGARVATMDQRLSTMLITQRGEALFVQIDGTAYQGRSDDSATSPTRATGTAVRCSDDGETCAAASGVLDLRVRINAARGVTKITAESTVPNARGASRCRSRFTRTRCEDPGVAPPAAEVCGDGIVNNAPNEECDGAATGTPCDGACTSACTCPTACEPLDVTGHWEGTWASDVTGESGPMFGILSHEGTFVFGSISFPPFGDDNFSPPFVRIGECAPAEFSTGAILPSGVVGKLEGVATNTSMAGTWAMSDASDHGTWQMSR